MGAYKNEQITMLNIKEKDVTDRLKAIIVELKKEIELLREELKRKNMID